MTREHSMNPDHALYADWDAAYILGALTPSDRRAYETHLQACELCRQAISEIASLPALLTAARPLLDAPGTTPSAADGAGRLGMDNGLGAADAAIAPPVDLVERIRAREDRRRRTTLRRRVAFAAVGAAAAIALAVGIPAALTGPATSPTTVTLAATAVPTDLTATVTLDRVAWGTSIAMDCTYPASVLDLGYFVAPVYSLVVTDDAGNSSQVSTWKAVPGKTIHLSAATAVSLRHIASVEIRSETGDTILSAPIGA